MTIFRNGQPRTPPKPDRERAASGFELWTWAAMCPPTIDDIIDAQLQAVSYAMQIPVWALLESRRGHDNN
jgi:hypothetical protein